MVGDTEGNVGVKLGFTYWCMSGDDSVTVACPLRFERRLSECDVAADLLRKKRF